ncbi:hypothetical protein HNR23_001148 [Nocardiopsis mwathae]|uniref:DUF742 domain-containing protein n=1 Tax=Nocardiopsis mwathae TaxID=1472723 RepID=A0A7W9YF84_9ACTN|nr:DUF742 domain-containing protein [Nocardiopsis mwathae]MBB6171088.1 hypothetical protein [Nocardiopsis mwathae]
MSSRVDSGTVKSATAETGRADGTRAGNGRVGSHRADRGAPGVRSAVPTSAVPGPVAACGGGSRATPPGRPAGAPAGTGRGECGATENRAAVLGGADVGPAQHPPSGRPETHGGQPDIRANKGSERLLRPFAITIGGAADTRGPCLDLLSMVTATRPPGPPDSLRPERETILLRSREPQSIVELAAHLDLPVSVVKLLAAGMIAEGALRLHAPEPEQTLTGLPLLYALLDGLRAL